MIKKTPFFTYQNTNRHKIAMFENDGPLICYKDPCLNYYYYVYYLILLHMYAAGCPSVRTFVFLTF